MGRKRGRQRTTGSHSRWSPEQTSHLGRQSTCFVTRGEGGTRGGRGIPEPVSPATEGDRDRWRPEARFTHSLALRVLFAPPSPPARSGGSVCLRGAARPPTAAYYTSTAVRGRASRYSHCVHCSSNQNVSCQSVRIRCARPALPAYMRRAGVASRGVRTLSLHLPLG